jgi:hypothetical protein
MLVELTSSLDTAWLYKSPITINGIAGRDFTPADADFKSDPSFRATKYFPDYPGLVGKDLTPGETIEGGNAECPVVTSTLVHETFDVHIYPNPVSDFLSVEAPNSGDELDVRIIDAWGRETIRERGHGALRISTNSLPNGFYITRVNNKSIKIIKRD